MNIVIYISWYKKYRLLENIMISVAFTNYCLPNASYLLFENLWIKNYTSKFKYILNWETCVCWIILTKERPYSKSNYLVFLIAAINVKIFNKLVIFSQNILIVWHHFKLFLWEIQIYLTIACYTPIHLLICTLFHASVFRFL